MMKYILYFSLGLILSTVSCTQKNTKPELLASCCDEGGRCTGSSSCSACSNCSGCKHCAQNGGSCGVCGGGSSSRSSFKSFYTSSGSGRTKTSKRKEKSNSSSTSSSISNRIVQYDNTTEVEYDAILTVKTSILNVRSGPGRDYSITTVLEKGDYVRCLETSSTDWIKVEVVATGVEGYVYKTNLEY